MNIVVARNLADRKNLSIIFIVPDTVSASEIRSELAARRKGRKRVKDGTWDITLHTADMIEIEVSARDVADYLREES